MPMRSRRRSFGRRPRTPVSWHTSPASWGFTVALTHAASNSFNMLDTQSRSASGASAANVDNVMRARIECIRGTLFFNNSSTTNQHVVSVGLIVVDYENNALTGSALNPSLALDSQKSWLWLKHVFCDIRAASGNSSASVAQFDIHIKTRRVLKPEQSLQLVAYDNALSGVADEVYLGIYLRTLLARIV